MPLRHAFRFALIAAAIPAAALAQSYPSKPIRILVPFPPGAFNDTLGRIIAQKFSDGGIGQTFVDNRAGAGSTLGADIAAKSPPDGHTLLEVAVPFAVNATLYTKLPYNTERDFAPLIFAGSTPNILVVHPSVPVTTIQQLIALAKAKPAQLTYASTGSGTSNHMSMELFKLMTNTDIVHVPYKGSAPAVTDLMGGHVMMIFDNTPNVLPYVKTGRMRGIAVTSLKRSALAPEIPTVDESGVKGFEVLVWFGLMVPAGVPREIVARLNAEINRILLLPDVKERFQAGGVDPVGGPPEKFGEHLKVEIAKWGKVVKATGARVD
ncbi:MAG: tripartite tricarboxylate transporter family receptor [Betaproteobacteria bacterium]|nr:tripartite tricarboxylate transporter family receptor [Betaproteobacteria bacterium]